MKFDIYEEVTNRIINQLEKGVIPWHKPWRISGIQIESAEDLHKVAFNRISKVAYSALNQMLLSKPGEYASFKQWCEIGGKIKKGSKAEIIVFWKWVDVKIKADESDPDSEEKLVNDRERIHQSGESDPLHYQRKGGRRSGDLIAASGKP